MERADALDAVMESTSSSLDILLSTIMVLQLVENSSIRSSKERARFEELGFV